MRNRERNAIKPVVTHDPHFLEPPLFPLEPRVLPAAKKLYIFHDPISADPILSLFRAWGTALAGHCAEAAPGPAEGAPAAN